MTICSSGSISLLALNMLKHLAMVCFGNGLDWNGMGVDVAMTLLLIYPHAVKIDQVQDAFTIKKDDV